MPFQTASYFCLLRLSRHLSVLIPSFLKTRQSLASRQPAFSVFCVKGNAFGSRSSLDRVRRFCVNVPGDAPYCLPSPVGVWPGRLRP